MDTKDWSVEVTRAGEETTIPWTISARFDSQVAQFLNLLEGHGPALSHGPGRYSVRLAVEARTPQTAIDQAATLVQKAAINADLPDWPEVHVEATEWEQFERDLDQPTYPEVVGIAEIAALLGASKQRASALARSPRFPRPFAELKAGPIWFLPNVQRFIEEWDRKPGRPRTVTT